MKAVIFKGANAPLQLADIPKPSPGEGEILIRVASTGVCHSDIHHMKGELLGFMPPEGFILGHEISGWVEDFGPNVTNPYGLQKGDPVIVSWIVPCGKCRYCASGKENYCNNVMMKMPGIIGINGGHAEYTSVPEIAVIPAREIKDMIASSPVSCAYGTAYGALKTAGASAGQSIVVVGTGGVGSAAIQLASVMGLYPIIAVDVVDSKLAKVKELGATHTVNPNKEDPVGKITEILPEGADIVYETKPNPDLQIAFNVVNKSGTMVVTGLGNATSSTINLMTNLFVGRGLRLVGSLGYRPRIDLPELVRMVASGKLDVKKLVTHVYRPDEINTAYENLEKGLHLRAIIDWTKL
ncbi:alcohol dehydrogenase [Sulfolobus acidocaldarius SUSAZ]|nr:alcohol dehydrogenase [Sulfolobus acidocaldarius SUSAZ]